MLELEVKNVTPFVDDFSSPDNWINLVYRVNVKNTQMYGDFVLFVQPGMLKCCGMGGLQRIIYLMTLPVEEQQVVFEFLKKNFGSPDRKERVCGYPHNQLFFTHATGVPELSASFMETFHVKKEATWQSASEPYHTTSLYSINF